MWRIRIFIKTGKNVSKLQYVNSMIRYCTGTVLYGSGTGTVQKVSVATVPVQFCTDVQKEGMKKGVKN